MSAIHSVTLFSKPPLLATPLLSAPLLSPPRRRCRCVRRTRASKMDTVAPRLSRSSTRYGPIGSSAATFSGPVRKWRKAWVPLAGAGVAGSGSGVPASRDNKVVLFKWTPANGGSGRGGASGGMEPAATRRRYVPAAGEAQNTSKKSSSSELNLNLELEDPDDDTDADLSTEEQRDIDNNPRPETRLKRKAF